MVRYILIFFALIIGGCSHSANKNLDKKVFKYNEIASLTSLDPAFAKDQANLWAVNQLFSGLVQAKKIGDLVGQKTAGATYLKSIYDLDGGSAIFMITSLTFFYDRRVYPPDGLDPDTVLAEDKDSLKVVLESLGQK